MSKSQVVIQIMWELIKKISADDVLIELSIYPTDWQDSYHASFNHDGGKL